MHLLSYLLLTLFPLHAFSAMDPMGREASGTSWQPDSSPMDMRHTMHGDWMVMTMAFANAVYTDSEARSRGDHDFFISSMAMLTAARPMGQGTLQLRTMFSLDPLLVGKRGYPLLYQTGETTDGRTPLIDRQHPHDLFAELAAQYSLSLGPHRLLVLYAGLPGEPALGPPTFMHRISGMDSPEAPLSHHWFDSTHITFGVVTAGLTWRTLKLEASAFNGREPDENRYDIEVRPLTSWSARATWNPTANWSGQVSFGRLKSPEQLEPEVDIDRSTASLTYNLPLRGGNWQTTFGAARNRKHPGDGSNAWLLESAWTLTTGYTFYSRVEHVSKDELFTEDEPLHGKSFTLSKLSVGGAKEVARDAHGAYGLGLEYHVHWTPRDLDPVYGTNPGTWLLYLRWRAR